VSIRKKRVRMDLEHLKQILEDVRQDRLPVEAALERLRGLPFEDIHFAKIDHHRHLRTGFPEVLYCPGKSLHQIRGIVVVKPRPVQRTGNVAVICAGTSDVPVAEEAAVTAEILGSTVQRIYDVGVAGLHRILDARRELFRARVAVVAAGMEGALASVVGGLVSCPVIAVPTSVGYGASFGGLAALLAMLNTCAAGVSVVNIDNGFGAGYQAALINRMGFPD